MQAPELRDTKPGLGPDSEPKPSPEEPSTPRPGDPVPRQSGVIDPRALQPGLAAATAAEDTEPSTVSAAFLATTPIPDPATPPKEPAPVPRPEDVPPRPGTPPEGPGNPIPGPLQPPPPEPPTPPAWARARIAPRPTPVLARWQPDLRRTTQPSYSWLAAPEPEVSRW
jgi:hypothetical protein